MINQLKFWYWRKYKDIPHPDEIKYIRELPISQIRINDDSTRKGLYKDRKWDVSGIYANGTSIEVIADSYGVTRERIRQIIRKFYWDYKRGKL